MAGKCMQVRKIIEKLYRSVLLAIAVSQVMSITHISGAWQNSFTIEGTTPKNNWREFAKNRSKLVENLLAGYDKRIRPFTGGHSLEVRVDMFVSNIWAIEEAKMDFTIDIYLRQYWVDPRLNFPPLAAGFDSGTPLTLNRQTIDQIWIPSTYFFNAKKAYFHDVTTNNYLLQIQPNGSIFYSVRLTVNVACKLDLREFPHDVQTCTVMLESYGYQAKDVFYRWNPRKAPSDVVYISEDLEMPQFLVTDVKLEERTNVYNIGNHSALAAKFTFQRRLGYYLIQTYIPSMLTVTISWFSFWISPDSPPARVGLGITTVLTMITISNSARAPLPKVSYTKAIDWFLLMCLVFVFGSLMEYAIVNFYSCKVVKRQKKRNIKGCERAKDSADEALNNEVHEVPSGVNGSVVQSESSEDQHFMTVLINHKNPFCSRSSRNYRTQTRTLSRPPSKKTHRRMTEEDTGDELTEDELQKPYYFWDPYEDNYMLTEPGYVVDKCARVFFPVTYIVLNSIYWMVYAPDEIVF